MFDRLMFHEKTYSNSQKIFKTTPLASFTVKIGQVYTVEFRLK